MNFFLPILFWLWPVLAITQVKDSITSKSLNNKSQTSNSLSKKPGSVIISKDNKPSSIKAAEAKSEIFTSGFIDIMNSGQVNASARFIRLYIGEPDKFSLPLSLYSGVSSNNFQSSQSAIQRSNEMLVTNFINPLSGLANISVDGVAFFSKKENKITRSGLLYHIGERVLSGAKTGLPGAPGTGRPVNFLNSFGAAGLYFQTGAWERSNSKNVGISWFAFRYIGCYTNPEQLKEFMPDIETDGIYHGYSLAWGVEITKLVNIKVVYYKYNKKPEIEYYLPIYQFSFNYSMKR